MTSWRTGKSRILSSASSSTTARNSRSSTRPSSPASKCCRKTLRLRRYGTSSSTARRMTFHSSGKASPSSSSSTRAHGTKTCLFGCCRTSTRCIEKSSRNGMPSAPSTSRNSSKSRRRSSTFSITARNSPSPVRNSDYLMHSKIHRMAILSLSAMSLTFLMTATAKS